QSLAWFKEERLVKFQGLGNAFQLIGHIAAQQEENAVIRCALSDPVKTTQLAVVNRELRTEKEAIERGEALTHPVELYANRAWPFKLQSAVSALLRGWLGY